MSFERKEMSFSRRRESQILQVSSLEAVTKKAPLGATAMRLTALLCSARCATSTPRGCQGVLLARLAAPGHTATQQSATGKHNILSRKIHQRSSTAPHGSLAEAS